MIPKISVIIITYNQGRLISRSIESVIKQKDYIYELIVSDDCSTDKTWEIITLYKHKYPEIIKPFKNIKNLGIFKHIEKTWEYPQGDIVFYLAGDDKFCDGLFKRTIDFISSNNIDYKNELFTIYLDYMSIKPNGRKKIVRNNLITKHNAVELKIRKLISNRTTGVSIKVLKKFKPVKEIGIFTDGLIDIQTQFYSKKNYYIPFIGSIYYKDIGIGSITMRKDGLKSFVSLTKEYMTKIKDLTNDDYNWLIYLDKRTEYLLEPNIHSYIKILPLFFKLKIIKYGYNFVIRETLWLVINLFQILKRCH